MNIIMTRLLMRQQSRTISHEHYRIKLWRGGGGQSLSICSIPATDSASQNFS